MKSVRGERGGGVKGEFKFGKKISDNGERVLPVNTLPV